VIFWLMVTTVTVTFAVWAIVLLDQHRTRTQSSSLAEANSWNSVHAIIVLSWLFWVLPSITGLTQVGRPATQFTAAVVTSLQTQLQLIISSLLVLVCFRLILRNFHRAPTASIWRLGAFLAPWLAIIVLSGLNAGYVTGRQFLLYPLIAVTIWLASPPLAVIRTVGVLGALTAGGSIVVALVTPLALVDGGSAGADKAIIGNGHQLLAGPYSDANGFAITLALAAPCLLLVGSRPFRMAGFITIAAALLWAAGRTSLLAAAVGFSVYVFAGQAKGKIKLVRLVGVVAAVAAFLFTVFTPFLETDPRAFTSRGLVWALSLSDWQHHHFWLGGGPMYYERSGLVSYIFSFKVIAGHNLMVDSLVRGGIVGAVAIGLLFVVACQQAVRLAPASACPMAFVVTFAFLSWLEVPLNLTNLGFLGYASWLPLAVIAFTRTQPEELVQQEVEVAQQDVASPRVAVVA
jgi:hypothetical protein